MPTPTRPRAVPGARRRRCAGSGSSFPRPDGSRRVILRDIDLSIAPGEIIALLGASGSRQVDAAAAGRGTRSSPTPASSRSTARRVAEVDQRCAVAFQEPRLLPVAHDRAQRPARAAARHRTRSRAASGSPSCCASCSSPRPPRCAPSGLGRHGPARLARTGAGTRPRHPAARRAVRRPRRAHPADDAGPAARHPRGGAGDDPARHPRRRRGARARRPHRPARRRARQPRRRGDDPRGDLPVTGAATARPRRRPARAAARRSARAPRRRQLTAHPAASPTASSDRDHIPADPSQQRNRHT